MEQLRGLLLDRLDPRAGAHDLVAHDLVGDPELTLDLHQALRRRLEVDDGVVAVGHVVDLVGELALAPVIDLLHRAALVADQLREAVDVGLDGRFVEVPPRDEQQFVRAQWTILWSMWPPLSGRAGTRTPPEAGRWSTQ